MPTGTMGKDGLQIVSSAHGRILLTENVMLLREMTVSKFLSCKRHFQPKC